MKISGIDIESNIENIQAQIKADKTLSPSMCTAMDLLLLIVTLLCQRLGLNSSNSSKPPSSDPNRKKNLKTSSTKKSGGQKGRKGTTLPLDIAPDITHKLPVDRALLPPGNYINGKRQWLHNASSLDWIDLSVHEKRGAEAMDEMGILPQFQGVMCHDHWKPYYRYKSLHALGNAHHLRELIRAYEQDG